MDRDRIPDEHAAALTRSAIAPDCNQSCANPRSPTIGLRSADPASGLLGLESTRCREATSGAEPDFDPARPQMLVHFPWFQEEIRLALFTREFDWLDIHR